ncbi:50S ribosomal protein L17 [bacterium]|nr:50S ribosomal protein L17 [candidate division CSSED10-310 bacterium]
MRHRKIKSKLNRSATHRKSMLNNMAASLIKHERISTTVAKAKEVRKTVDYLVTLAKREDLHARRQALKIIPDKKIVKKLFDTYASRYTERPGGYTRIYRLGTRRGDAAPLAVIEMVGGEIKE